MSAIVDDLRDFAMPPLAHQAADEIEELEKAYELLFKENGTLRAALSRQSVAPAAQAAPSELPPIAFDAMHIASRLQSFADRLCNDKLLGEKYEGDESELRNAITMLRHLAKAATPSPAVLDGQMSSEKIDAIWGSLPGIEIYNKAAKSGQDTAHAMRIAFARAVLAARPDHAAVRDWKAAYEQKLADFQAETLRASNLHAMVEKFVAYLRDIGCRSEDWPKKCCGCDLMIEAIPLLQSTPATPPDSRSQHD